MASFSPVLVVCFVGYCHLECLWTISSKEYYQSGDNNSCQTHSHFLPWELLLLPFTMNLFLVSEKANLTLASYGGLALSGKEVTVQSLIHFPKSGMEYRIRSAKVGKKNVWVQIKTI